MLSKTYKLVAHWIQLKDIKHGLRSLSCVKRKWQLNEDFILKSPIFVNHNLKTKGNHQRNVEKEVDNAHSRTFISILIELIIFLNLDMIFYGKHNKQ